MPTPEREVKEPTVTKAPPAGRKFPCPKCGAKLDFDPTARALACPYCGHTVAIEHGNKDLKEHDLEAYLRDRDSLKTPVKGHANEVTCPACAAVVLLEDKVVTDRCPYCGTHLENQPRVAEAMIQPEGVLPFKVDQRAAVDAFAHWIAGLWFAPNALRKLADLGRLDGLYVPFWTFDSMTYTHYTGERGDDYWETETYTETNAQGQTETKTRQVRKTRWTPVSGQVRHFFDDVLVCASKGLPEGYRNVVVPQELKGLEDFKAEFLSGFKTERYQIGPRDGFEQARAIMDQAIRRLCEQDIGGDHQRLQSVQTRHVGVTFKHILLPVWLANYRYQQKTYRVLVNGRTGQILGDRPYSWLKITLLVLGIILAIALAVLLFTQVAKGGEPPARHAHKPEAPARETLAGASGLSRADERDHGRNLFTAWRAVPWTRSSAVLTASRPGRFWRSS
ncbi:MAG TPA: zinc ribbon domain-containing protein [Gemmataceae bacterium]|nr:zinc ribbon domain-containing protein [Gemmataceae bacterium]